MAEPSIASSLQGPVCVLLIHTTDVCLVWAGDVAEEEPEEEDDQLRNLDEEEIKKMQSDEVLSLLVLFCLYFCWLPFFLGPYRIE